MKQTIDIQVANPAGNITIFVLNKFERSQYARIASQLLAMEEFEAEQVAFVTGEDAMEMCGLEFCGNAARAFALMTAINRGLSGDTAVDISVSGSAERLPVFLNADSGYTKVKMPLPLSVKTLTDDYGPLSKGSRMVDFGGILHIIVTNKKATAAYFDEVKTYIYSRLNPPALGVMFFDTEKNFMTPVVYVKDVNSTYFEGSCGSGSTAAAAAFSAEETDGTFSFTLPQPAGSIISTAEKKDGVIDAIYIEGPVSLSEIVKVTIEV